MNVAVQCKHALQPRAQQLTVRIEPQASAGGRRSDREKLSTILGGQTVTKLNIRVGRRLREQQQSEHEVHGEPPVYSNHMDDQGEGESGEKFKMESPALENPKVETSN